ncbi:TIGR04282 family arsenosugar biosynthesis glycosyltransferase [Croceitalea rosinachiae]|uniref:TIGR04282 family arsenosugar biosynthesis glycosyltransferase n=1 Tax=Croceitalea rosinachiae TaxID=3075596 RepID=A0ABU3AA25_9FLAO|nr:TIGR04282 family arsenosugar biosynthesis glycosyltransferase [Croceitalea sp. F388]MDT0606738.1 TIGR04282 family arsenosugar biosynthesis glycosyltransferase [Croceitalea sp. F388]
MKNNATDLLLIFTRNPELGKCKTRLAATIGDKAALDIYKFLLRHTVEITKNLFVEKYVYYSEDIWEDDIWNSKLYTKKLQEGIDLGERMKNAFADGFKNGFQKIIIIGSDMYDLSQDDLANAFSKLDEHDFVIGPALDGGYYLLGMKYVKEELFSDKVWGTGTVLKHTLKNLANDDFNLVDERNDVDFYEDIKDNIVFQPFLQNLKK